jgi:uncharacterized DUF497 family protein
MPRTIHQAGWRYRFDEEKCKEVLAARQVDFETAVELFDGHYYQDACPLYPHQERAIGRVGEKLVTIIIEERMDEDGPYTWIANAWKTTLSERKKYEHGK